MLSNHSSLQHTLGNGILCLTNCSTVTAMSKRLYIAFGLAMVSDRPPRNRNVSYITNQWSQIHNPADSTRHYVRNEIRNLVVGFGDLNQHVANYITFASLSIWVFLQYSRPILCQTRDIALTDVWTSATDLTDLLLGDTLTDFLLLIAIALS